MGVRKRLASCPCLLGKVDQCDENQHQWDLSAGQRAALKGRHSDVEAARRYGLAMWRRLGWKPLEVASAPKLYPHAACDCSASCRARLGSSVPTTPAGKLLSLSAKRRVVVSVLDYLHREARSA